MTRDTYAKELIKAAEAAFYRNETPVCPHEGCYEHLSVVRQSMFTTRSLCCPVHGRVFQEQEANPFGRLDWEGAAQRVSNADSEEWLDDADDVEDYEQELEYADEL